ncbi:MAG TPA: alcohol dehydrogenase catalytic domain-containing protein [Ramlibacter sp.]|nr:alcohol dehydrogenase catalytic domain-containing protein [Ramlibacter sp.]
MSAVFTDRETPIELACIEPGVAPQLAIQERAPLEPRAGMVLVRVAATSVNPIDAKRAAGYGRRLLGLKGAGRFPLVLGNDLVGVVQAVGATVDGVAVSQRVMGLVGTGRAGGAHASHVLVPAAQLVPAPEGTDAASLAVLPYSFTTMWLAVRSAGLLRDNARGLRVLVHGGCGGLGQLALQLLRSWGVRVTAICGPGNSERCLAAGAEVAIERSSDAIASLPPTFDAVLNFASWDDDAALATRLGSQGRGHATTVHPLLGNMDSFGLLRGALRSRRDWAGVGRAVSARAPHAAYKWTVFQPQRAALEALAAGLQVGRFQLPVGVDLPFERADEAFRHVSSGGAGRAVLRPHKH